MPQNMQELVIIGNISLVKVSNWSIIMSNKRKRLRVSFSEWCLPHSFEDKYGNALDLVEKSIEGSLNTPYLMCISEAIVGSEIMLFMINLSEDSIYQH